MINLTPEMIEKAKAAKSAEELLEIAKANNVEMTADEAATYFAQLNPTSGELDDNDLDNVAGGACAGSEAKSEGEIVRVTSGQTCKKCGNNIGTLSTPPYGELTVYCNNCDKVIEKAALCTYEVIG